MRSPSDKPAMRKTLGTLRFLASEAVVLGPIALFAYLLRAEGPLAYLYAWAGAITALFFAFFSMSGIPRAKGEITAPKPPRGKNAVKGIKAGVTVIAAIVSVTGALTVLVQVQVVPHSLAEAWLDLVRKGEGFGFFSFFASEIYALFLVAQCVLFIRRQYARFFLAFCATSLLCAGIIAGNALFLSLTIAAAFAFLVRSGTAKREHARKRQLVTRLLSVSVPLIAAMLYSLWFAFNPNAFESVKNPFPHIDIGAIVARLAPSYPLVNDIPGYGSTADVASMPASVYLSGRPIFTAQGESETVHYLATDRYTNWNGQNWATERDPGDAIPVTRMNRGDARKHGDLRLTLVEDFTTTIPLDRDTVSVAISREAPSKTSLFRNRGIRFEPSVQRGFIADLAEGTVSSPPPEGETLASALGSLGARSPGIEKLAAELRARAKDDRDYLRILLDYLADGYTYSLKTGSAPKGADPVEAFLFGEKKGFCLYFASAFVLLAREGGIPARLCEGYRVLLDENGYGVISGNNAHAWPEVYLEGAWRTFEPTPPYREEDPFAWTRGDDRDTRRQLEALFGARAEEKEKGTATFIGPAVLFLWANLSRLGLALFAAAAVAVALFLALDTGDRKLRRKARRAVAKYRRKGVQGPEEAGWTGWIRSVEKAAPSPDAAAEARALADAIISLAFARPRGGKPS